MKTMVKMMFLTTLFFVAGNANSIFPNLMNNEGKFSFQNPDTINKIKPKTSTQEIKQLETPKKQVTPSLSEGEKYPDPEKVIKIEPLRNDADVSVDMQGRTTYTKSNRISHFNINGGNQSYHNGRNFRKKVLEPAFNRYPVTAELYKKSKTNRRLMYVGVFTVWGSLPLIFYGGRDENREMLVSGISLGVVALLFTFVANGKCDYYFEKSITSFNNGGSTTFHYSPHNSVIGFSSNQKFLELEYAYRLSLNPVSTRDPFKIKKSVP